MEKRERLDEEGGGLEARLRADWSGEIDDDHHVWK